MNDSVTEAAALSVPLGNLITFLIALILFLLLYLASRNKYNSLIDPLDKKDFPLKSLMGIGCFIMELIRYSYDHHFDREFRKKLIEIYEKEYCEYYLRMYYAAAATYLSVGILLIGVFAAADVEVGYAIFLGAVIGVLLAYTVKNTIDKKYESRHIKISMELPDVANKLVILLGAGLTLRAAWQKIAMEMSNESPLYDEMKLVVKQIENGVSDTDAFNNMSLRCNIPQMRRFISIIVQNIHRGGNDLSNAITFIGQELWESRKALARRLTEEASTKLLFPMMLMLFTVIIITVATAALGMSLSY